MTNLAQHGLAPSGEAPYPAITAGKLAPPPPSHILDFLVRHYIVLEENAPFDPSYWELITDDPGTVAMVSELPACDLCRLENREPAVARYDGPSSSGPNAPWAFLCPDCFVLQAPPVLGLGRAQYLFTKEEIPDEVRDAFFRARKFWIEKGIEAPPHDPFE